MHATKAAVEEGFVPGGGVAFLRCIEAVQALKERLTTSTSVSKIVHRALEEPASRPKIVADERRLDRRGSCSHHRGSCLRDQGQKEGGNGGGGMGEGMGGMY